MKVVVDMNLSPDWVTYLSDAGHEVIHWSSVGAVDAPDAEIVCWAAEHDCTVLTSDLDFGTILATSGLAKPSVVQLRSGSTLPTRVGTLVVQTLLETEAELSSGALVTIEDDRLRLRLLNFAAKE